MNKIQQKPSNDKFKNQWGFIIACIGSSVGMANIWLFPYRIGEFGGSAFLIPYILFVVLIGFTGVIGEMAFGRAMQTGPLGAFSKAFEQRGQKKLGEVIGLIPVVGSLGITMFWVCKKGFARNAIQEGREKKVGKWLEPMTKYVFCVVAVLVYILGIFFGGIG